MITGIRKSILSMAVALIVLGSVQPAQAQLPTSTIVLVVDDTDTLRNAVINNLVQLGFKSKNIFTAASGSEALEKIGAKTFELVIADWTMDPMTGLDLLKALRADEKTKALPFVMMTAESKTEQVEFADPGTVYYLLKPFNSASLKIGIEHVMGKKF